MSLPADTQLVLLALAAAVLRIPGRIIDQYVRRLPNSPTLDPRAVSLVWQRPCELSSLLSSVVLAFWTIAWFVSAGGSPALWLATLLLIGLLLTVVIGIGRHFQYAQPQWVGLNRLALLLVAGFYFYQAIERRQAGLWLLPAAMIEYRLDAALARTPVCRSAVLLRSDQHFDTVEPILAGTMQVMRHLARQRGVHLEFAISEPLSPVRAVENAAREIFFNLLSNAIEAAGEGGSVKIDCQQDNGHVVTRFHDTGPGISPADQDQLFQPFFTTKRTGTGLGLYVTNRHQSSCPRVRRGNYLLMAKLHILIADDERPARFGMAKSLANPDYRFRQDLYYRIKGVELKIPPLRHRREDILLLADFFLDRHAARVLTSQPGQASCSRSAMAASDVAATAHGKLPLHFSQDAVDAMLAHPWPGNVRELEHTITAAAALAASETIRAADLRLPTAKHAEPSHDFRHARGLTAA